MHPALGTFDDLPALRPAPLSLRGLRPLRRAQRQNVDDLLRLFRIDGPGARSRRGEDPVDLVAHLRPSGLARTAQSFVDGSARNLNAPHALHGG